MVAPAPMPDTTRARPLPERGAHSTRAYLGLGAMVLIWAVNFSVIKIALASLPPLAFNALRFPIASVAMYGLLRASGPIPVPRGADAWRVLALGLLGNTVYQLFFISGMEHAHAGIASLLLSGTPVMTALLSSGLGHERLGPRMWAAVAATFGGMALVVLGGRGASAGGAPVWANLVMLGASASWAVYTVGSSGLIKRYGPAAFTAWTLWWGTTGIVLTGLPELLRVAPAQLPAKTWLALAYSGAFSIGVAYFLSYYGVRHLGNTRTAVFNNLVPDAALVVAWLWLGEIPSGLQLAGAAVIVGGVSLTRRGH